MNTQDRIRNLQQHRRDLLARRRCRGAPIAALDTELKVVRNELLDLYASERASRSTIPLAQGEW